MFGDIQRDEVFRSFSIFNMFEYDEAYKEFFDLLNDDGNKSPDEIYDTFVEEIHKKLDFILKQHTIVLSETVGDYFTKNEILEALYTIQSLEDYEFISRTMESELSDEEKLCSILAEYCSIDQFNLLNCIDEFSPTLLVRIKSMADEYLEDEDEDTEDNSDIIKNLKLFKECFGEDSLGIKMTTMGIIVGAEFKTYLPFVENDIVAEKIEDTALNILSLLYMTREGLSNPLEAYANNSEYLFQDLTTITEVRQKIIQHLGKFNEFKMVKHEKERVSENSF